MILDSGQITGAEARAFIARCRDDMQAIRQALAARDYAAIDRLAQGMVPKARNFDLDGISDVARAVARCAASGHGHILPGLVDHLGRMVEREIG